eukprot:CAMPEP_0172205564 /NCGR_PEP_ID=MMETSP1050-20130122/32687_1 /TAXON_ID=233186 /ORGANISM="Cryptomonas curvata, Strain CCAP979/52" /LENGTH=277 /DNA_ID=CAMNT_0012884459 /DNA_START=94 /DNA_END=927 /DNA_ORIENTATION=-
MTDGKQSDSELREISQVNSHTTVLDQLSSVLQSDIVRIGQKSSYIAKCLKAGSSIPTLTTQPPPNKCSLNFDTLERGRISRVKKKRTLYSTFFFVLALGVALVLSSVFLSAPETNENLTAVWDHRKTYFKRRSQNSNLSANLSLQLTSQHDRLNFLHIDCHDDFVRSVGNADQDVKAALRSIICERGPAVPRNKMVWHGPLNDTYLSVQAKLGFFKDLKAAKKACEAMDGSCSGVTDDPVTGDWTLRLLSAPPPPRLGSSPTLQHLEGSHFRFIPAG